MPLWDSVHRGLEKASQEAARMAKTQRLRSSIDQLARQMQQQNDTIVNTTMQLFVAGQLTQNELIPMCRALGEKHQQLMQAQNELRQLQSSQNQPPVTGQPPVAFIQPGMTPPGPYTTGDALSETALAPPPPEYQTFLEPTNAADIPPPPPGVDALTVSAHGVLAMSGSVPYGEQQFCQACQSSVAAGNQFCPNCGAPLQDSVSSHQPTTWAAAASPIHLSEQETKHAEQPGTFSAPKPDEALSLQTPEGEKEV